MSYTQIETAIFEGTPVPAHVAGDDEDYTYEPVQVATISREELAALRQSVQEAEALAAAALFEWRADLGRMWWAVQP